MEIVEYGRLTAEHRAALEGDEDDPFGGTGSTLHHRPKERHVGIRDDSGRLVASTGMLVIDVEVEDRSFAVVGIGGVIVNAQHRGHGLARVVLRAALAKARSLGPEFAILFCFEDRAGLYLKFGFATIRAEVVVKQPDGYAPMSQLAMWRALRPGAIWPDGAVVVQSLPF
jgi:predicted N-acetyltransferase YhbS